MNRRFRPIKNNGVSEGSLFSQLDIRKEKRYFRSSLSFFEHYSNSQKICQSIVKHPWFKSSRSIGFYNSFDGECDLSVLFKQAILQKKQCYFPYITQGSRQLTFIRQTSMQRFISHTYGLKQPLYTRYGHQSAMALDLVLVPTVAFSSKGYRLGMGGGYYDYSFQQKNKKHMSMPRLLGVAFSGQETQHLIPNTWDVKLNAIATQQGVCYC